MDDPSSHPEQFPTEEAQQQERERLFGILTRLVKWENSNDEGILAEAKAEIMKSTNGNPPALLDPFAGGGAIPLEAQRLGLEAHAHDLNPVAVMINKAMIEIPPKFAGRSPVNPEAQRQGAANQGWKGAAGLAEDVRYYGEWMKQEACKRIGHLYPKAKLEDGSEATVIAWIWARTVKCPNPACGCEMPLVRSFTLSKKKGHEAWIKATYTTDGFEYTVQQGSHKEEGTVDRKGATCLKCGSSVDFPYIRNAGKNGQMNSKLIAVVAEGSHGRVYLSANSEQLHAAIVVRPEDYPDAKLPKNPRDFKTPNYGLTTFADLFTNRQLTALTTFSSLVSEAQQKAEADAVAAGVFNDHIALSEGGSGARAYGEAVGVYLAFGVSRMTDIDNALCRWEVTKTQVRNLFSRQAIPMVWDYAENNVFNNAAGDYTTSLGSIIKVIERFEQQKEGTVRQFDAQSDSGLRNVVVSTDPPYYDNIGYADLSDFFYVWMRQALKETYPKLFRTMLVPKAEELVATPYRFDGSVEKARDFFEDGMFNTCCRLHDYSRDDIPVTIYYAFKQSETDTEDTTASTGWETMLSAIIRAGFSITGTWPMRTELANRTIASGTNALASSIVLVCRKRDETTGSATRREFINALHREMRPALEKLQSANIAPVDLAQSAIGPGIGVFSRYKSVLEADGKPMSVRAALQIINQELDAFYNEQEGELDRESRFCVELFSQYAFNNIKFGDADILARAKNTSVQALAYRLYTICERKNWAQEGYAYNNLVVAWPDIQSAAAQMQAEIPVQIKMELL